MGRISCARPGASCGHDFPEDRRKHPLLLKSCVARLERSLTRFLVIEGTFPGKQEYQLHTYRERVNLVWPPGPLAKQDQRAAGHLLSMIYHL